MAPNIEQPQTNSGTNFKYVGFWLRFGAYLIDFIILSILGFVLRSVLAPGSFEYSGIAVLSNMNDPAFIAEAKAYQDSLNPVQGLLGLLIALGYFILFYVHNHGATLGKAAVGAKLVNLEGGPVTYPQVLIRYIMTFVSALPLGLGYFWVAFNKKKQGWHDMAAKTYVIESKPMSSLGYFLSILAAACIFGYLGLFVYLTASSVKNIVSEETDHTDVILETRKSYGEEIKELEATNEFTLAKKLLDQVHDSEDTSEIRTLSNQRVDLLVKIVEKYPENSAGYYFLGGAYTWANDRGTLQDSIKNYEKAIELDPNNHFYYRDAAIPYMNSKQYKEAILLLQKSLDLNSIEQPLAYFDLANAYAGLGINDKALENYEISETQYEELNSDGSYDESILQVQIQKAKLK